MNGLINSLALVSEAPAKYSWSDLVTMEGKAPLEACNIYRKDMLVCHRDGGPWVYDIVCGPAVLLLSRSRGLGISSAVTWSCDTEPFA